ncbi:MAG: pilin [Lachnospiraceae bacterium]|nr:pilin [Lachnospiraceae bacterium]
MMLLNQDNPFAAAAAPIVSLINKATGPLIAIVVALGAIYSIFLGVKLAKAEEPQDKMKAKGQLKNAIIGFILIFVLIVVLNVATGPLTEWMEGAANISVNVPDASN